MIFAGSLTDWRKFYLRAGRETAAHARLVCLMADQTCYQVINPPLTFVIDTTKSVKPDKDSIFNLTGKVVQSIQVIYCSSML